MSRPPADPSERLLSSNATDFERRLLEAAQRKRPSPAASARMARALGVSVAAVGTAATSTTMAAGAAASNAAAATGGLIWPWVSVGVIGLVVAGAVVGTRAGHTDDHRQVVSTPVTVPAPPDPEPSPRAQPSAVVAERPIRVVAQSPRSRTATTAGDLGEQVAFIDSARAAVFAGEGRRALEILRRYQDKYATGSFRPEATAIKVEALMKLGRATEARALAERFVAEHRGTLLARRVADVAGLTVP
jgi:hypothetical protein